MIASVSNSSKFWRIFAKDWLLLRSSNLNERWWPGLLCAWFMYQKTSYNCVFVRRCDALYLVLHLMKCDISAHVWQYFTWEFGKWNSLTVNVSDFPITLNQSFINFSDLTGRPKSEGEQWLVIVVVIVFWRGGAWYTKCFGGCSENRMLRIKIKSKFWKIYLS